MKKYEVEVEVVCYGNLLFVAVEVEAETEEEARAKAKEKVKRKLLINVRSVDTKNK